MNIEQIFKFANSNVGLLILGFILTTVLGSLLAKRIEKAAYEHKTRFSKLHEDRGKVIREIHDMIVEIYQNLINLFYKYRPIGISPPAPDENDVINSIRIFRIAVEKSRIYFSKELGDILESVCSDFEAAFRELESAYIMSTGENPGFEETEFMKYFENSKTARAELEDEFRKILGVT